MSSKNFGAGYWSTRKYRNIDVNWTPAELNENTFKETDNVSDFNNILPDAIDGKSPMFYELELHLNHNVPIRINDKYIIEPVDYLFKMDANDKPIRKLEILATGTPYYAFGKYM